MESRAWVYEQCKVISFNSSFAYSFAYGAIHATDGCYFDQNRCIGFWACMVACKDWNNLALGPAKWRRVSSAETLEPPLTQVYSLSVSCNPHDE
jgi:Fe-S-cluster-containing dehydrogenase component